MAYFKNVLNAVRGINYTSTNTTIGTKDDIPKTLNVLTKGTSFTEAKANNIAVVYSCIKILADSVSRLNIDVFETLPDGSELKAENDIRYNILSYEPNGYQNAQKFWSAVEYNRNLHGNSYVKIQRYNGSPVSLHILKPSTYVGSTIKNNQLYYVFKEDGKLNPINSFNILHFMNISSNGIEGISPIEAMRTSLSINYQAYNTVNNMYANGLKSAKALKWTMNQPDPKRQKEALDTFQNEYGGVEQAGGVTVLPKGADLIDLQIDPKDAEFINTIRFTTLEIASSFRVPAHMLNILEASKFNSVEQTQLDFIQNGLGSILKMYREELEFKLLSLEERKSGMTIKFNVKSMMETDTKTRIDIYDKQVKGSMLSINEVRVKEGLKPVKNGDEIIVPSNYVFLSQRDTTINKNDVKIPSQIDNTTTS